MCQQNHHSDQEFANITIFLVMHNGEGCLYRSLGLPASRGLTLLGGLVVAHRFLSACVLASQALRNTKKSFPSKGDRI